MKMTDGEGLLEWWEEIFRFSQNGGEAWRYYENAYHYVVQGELVREEIAS